MIKTERQHITLSNYSLKSAGSDEKVISFFSDDLDFIMTEEQKEEFDKRYNYTINNMSEGKTWNEIEQELLSK